MDTTHDPLETIALQVKVEFENQAEALHKKFEAERTELGLLACQKYRERVLKETNALDAQATFATDGFKFKFGFATKLSSERIRWNEGYPA